MRLRNRLGVSVATALSIFFTSAARAEDAKVPPSAAACAAFVIQVESGAPPGVLSPKFRKGLSGLIAMRLLGDPASVEQAAKDADPQREACREYGLSPEAFGALEAALGLGATNIKPAFEACFGAIALLESSSKSSALPAVTTVYGARLGRAYGYLAEAYKPTDPSGVAIDHLAVELELGGGLSGRPFLEALGQCQRLGLDTHVLLELVAAASPAPAPPCHSEMTDVGARCSGQVIREDRYRWIVTKPGAYALTVFVPARKVALNPGLVVTDATGAELAKVAGGVGGDATAAVKVKAGTYAVKVYLADDFKKKDGYPYQFEISAEGASAGKGAIKSWTEKAALGMDLFATVRTNLGAIRLKLYSREAPKTVQNFVGLATGEREWRNPATGKSYKGVPLYNGTVFHRVITGFMIQGGDPLGTGTGNPGYQFEDEVLPSLTFTRPGLLAMANAGPDTNGCQFFITTSTPAYLNGKNTIFGEVVSGYDVVEAISSVPTVPTDRPRKPVIIESISISETP